MRYAIRRITPGSSARLGCLLGWFVSIVPSLLLAWVSLKIIQTLDFSFRLLQAFPLVVLGQNISVNLVEKLNLTSFAQQIGQYAANATLTFIVLTLFFLVLGTLWAIFSAIQFSMSYNLVSALGGSLEIELEAQKK
jgi:hypothetical protein